MTTEHLKMHQVNDTPQVETVKVPRRFPLKEGVAGFPAYFICFEYTTPSGLRLQEWQIHVEGCLALPSKDFVHHPSAHIGADQVTDEVL